MSRALPRVRAVTLDVNGTLLSCPDLGREYSRVLARHGIELDATRLGELVVTVWRELACAAHPARDRFAAHPEGAPGFWRRFVERVAELGGATRPSRFAAAELYERFATAAPWRLYDDTLPALDALAERGLVLAVVSNWDERLPRVLAAHGLTPRFRTIVYSQAVGVEKPHRAIFEAAVAALGVAPAEVVHVGDSPREDVEGARAAGLGALLLARDGGGDLASLAELPAAIHSARGLAGAARATDGAGEPD